MLADQVDALTGILEPIELVQPKGLIASSIWSIAVAVGLASMVIMIIVLARGGDLATGTLPQGCAPMQPMVRLAALCIDLVRGLLVFFLVTEGTLRELVRVPMMSMNADDIVPYAWLVLVTVCWCGIWELASGTSMGKGICGGRVRSTTGNELKARQVLVRNFRQGTDPAGAPAGHPDPVAPESAGSGGSDGQNRGCTPTGSATGKLSLLLLLMR